ncbi:MAG: type II secretion system GspH family protein [Puniceicoccales bacterium]|jgi:prepilin-type N-terminal cleavage/methylation domain-containing protein|nr:type II secretion system GspH family protein [Puniceicoccales bacterium]
MRIFLNSMNRCPKTGKKNAFTVLELMMVMTVIAILASLVVPTFSKVKRSISANQSKIQLNRYVFGLNAYYREYGYFPRIVHEDADLTPEEVITLNATASANLIRALSGKEPEGARLSSANEYLNPHGIQFIEFSDNDFKKLNETYDRSLLADRFNNADIKLVVENNTDADALIPQSVFDHYLTIKDKVPSQGLREKIVFFTVGDRDQSMDVVSWKTD